MTTTPPTTSKPRRRWFQFSLRTLMVFVLVASVPLGWLSIKMNQARRQREAIKGIRELGGIVHYSPASGGMLQTAAIRVGKLLGEDLAVNVTAVDFRGSPVTDPGLEHLQGLTQLRTLLLDRTQVTDAGLTHLRGMTQLQQLHVNCTQVTDAGLVNLRGLTQLEYLELENAPVANAGLEYLRGLTRLEWLRLDSTQIDDAGLQHLRQLKQLRVLTLSDTRVTDAGVGELQKALPRVKIKCLPSPQPIPDASHDP